MNDLIIKLSEIRSKYNCFDEGEEPCYRALSEAIKILSQRADGDTVSRQAAIKGAKELFAIGDCHCDEYSIVGMLNSLPSAQPERKAGKWIDETFKPRGLAFHPYKCDQCGEHSETDSNFCPNCGADMREGDAK